MDAAALLYVALPNSIFLAGWIVAPLGPARPSCDGLRSRGTHYFTPVETPWLQTFLALPDNALEVP